MLHETWSKVQGFNTLGQAGSVICFNERSADGGVVIEIEEGGAIGRAMVFITVAGKRQEKKMFSFQALRPVQDIEMLPSHAGGWEIHRQ